jgi:nucleoside-diphosphate-sugar epimerase
VDGLTVGTLASAIARRFGSLAPEMRIVSADAFAAEKGEWARGYALDQRMSGEKAMRELGWRPVHLDLATELAEHSWDVRPRTSRS